jgi:hypothetical protein
MRPFFMNVYAFHPGPLHIDAETVDVFKYLHCAPLFVTNT